MQGKARLDPKAVQKLADESATSTDFILGLHAMAYGPAWEKIRKLQDHPIVNPTTAKKLCQLSIDIDQRNQVNHMVGGPWLNYGFSAPDRDTLLRDFEVELAPAEMEA